MLSHLALSDFDGLDVVMCFVDDASEDQKTLRLIKEFDVPEVRLMKIYKDKNTGVFKSLKTAWDTLLEHGCTHLTNLDSDTLMKRKWLKTLLSLHDRTEGKRIVTGYNSVLHPLEETCNGYGLKKRIGGINLLFDQKLYRNLVRDCDTQYWDDYLCEQAQYQGVLLIVSLPSLIQHIGIYGLNCRPDSMDFAKDYV
jgi:hypothetical protein